MRKLTEVTGVSFETRKKSIEFVPAEQVFPAKNGNFKVLCKEMARKDGRVYWNVKGEKKSLAMKDLVGKIRLSCVMDIREGEPFSLSMQDEAGHQVTVTGPVAEKALSRVTAEADIEKQLARLGNTWFTLEKASIHNAGCMVPKSVLNHMRQEAVEQLSLCREKEHEAGIPKPKAEAVIPAAEAQEFPHAPHVTLRTDSLRQLEEGLQAGIRSFIFGGESFHHQPIPFADYEKAAEEVHGKGGSILFAAPRVVREKNSAKAKQQFQKLLALQPDGAFVEYAGAAEWMQGTSIPLVAGPSMNLFNQEALAAMEALGFSGAYVSQELTIPQIRDIAKKAAIPLGAYVYGRTEMMISEYCVINSQMGTAEKKKCPGYCMHGSYWLKDGEGRMFPVKTDEWCHMHIQNCKVLDIRPYVPELLKAGLSSLCLDVRGLEIDTAALCRIYEDIVHGRMAPPKPSEQQNVTRGHFFRGVL